MRGERRTVEEPKSTILRLAGAWSKGRLSERISSREARAPDRGIALTRRPMLFSCKKCGRPVYNLQRCDQCGTVLLDPTRGLRRWCRLLLAKRIEAPVQRGKGAGSRAPEGG